MIFEELLARAAEPTLQTLVGRAGVRLLTRLDPVLAQPSKLREVAVGLKSPQEMLMDVDSRRELLPLLPPNEANVLVAQLGLDTTGDPYETLETLTVPRNSRRASALFDYFALAEPPQPPPLPSSVEHVSPVHGLFPHQRLAARRVLQALTTEPKRVLLHMPTGSGKTRTAMNVIAELLNQHEPMLVVWLAHSEELCEQAIEEFRSAWEVLGNRPVCAYRWWGEHELDPATLDDGLLVAGLAKAYAGAQRAVATIGAIAGKVGLVVIDEAHKAVAETYEHVLTMLTQAGTVTPLLGLTATPGRSWSDIAADERLADFFFRRKVTLEVEGYDSPVEYLVDKQYLARTRFDSLYYDSGDTLSSRDLRELEAALDIPTRILRALAEDEQRNLVIIHRTESMLAAHQRLLIFAATVDHALLLATVLRARGAIANAVTGGTLPEERARVIAAYRSVDAVPRVLVNFGVLTMGFDAPRTSGAIIARPTKSLVLYSQMVGRATRGVRAGGNEEAEVVTVVDTALPGFASLTEAFYNWEDVWRQS
jgi:superfamily II DNA or RNA helicase